MAEIQKNSRTYQLGLKASKREFEKYQETHVPIEMLEDFLKILTSEFNLWMYTVDIQNDLIPGKMICRVQDIRKYIGRIKNV